MVRTRFTFRGTVQGVGFRPAVYRLAVELDLSGFVQNRRSEVVAEVQGEESRVQQFSRRIASALPGAARVESMTEQALPTAEENAGFRIVESGQGAYSFPPIPPDLPLCPDCAGELLDPGNRRYLYPFITCTQCGPRYSIVERTPFDRANTTMAPFRQCPACEAEYLDPRDRRFHSQTNSCPSCGPSLRCVDSAGSPLDGDPLAAATDALARGLVVALHGIGGFHLAADPRSARAVERLRRDKDRERKPFAVMVRDVEAARRLCRLSPEEEAMLQSPEAPIVIAPRRAEAPDWTFLVSDTETLGVMRPYTPLHLLLFRHPRAPVSWEALIMTSGNRAGEPIITDPAEARDTLAAAADVFVFHDRRIAFHTDDSVARHDSLGPAFLLRRSRGYVPRLIRLAAGVSGVCLALGGDLKNAPALARGRDLHLSAFIGDLESSESREQFDVQVRQLLRLYEVSPDVVVSDMHPGYYSSRWVSPAGWRRRQVQHHHAHALSVMAEHGLTEALAFSFDGTGYGTDGTIWGGEFLHATRAGFTRLGSFAPFPLPGGDEAVRHPPRVALALLGESGRGRIPGLDAESERIILAMISRGVRSPVTTSLGRIFDAAAAVLGLVDRTTYEGEGPIRLEGKGLVARAGGSGAVAGVAVGELVQWGTASGDERLFLLDSRPLLSFMLEHRGGVGPERLSLLFHEAIAAAAVEAARRMRRHTGVSILALSGGVFQNLLLRELLVPPLIKEGFEVFFNVQAPPGDGGLAVGQAWFDPQ